MSKEVRRFEEEQRTASAVTQARQCAWTKWNDIKPIKLSWKSLIAMQSLAMSFLLLSTYDLLPNEANLELGDIRIRICTFTVKVIGVPCAICMSTIASNVHMVA